MLRNSLNNILFYLLAMLMCFPILHMKVSNFLIVIFALFSLASAIYYRKENTWVGYKELLIYIAPFVLILLSVLLRETNQEAKFYLEKSLSLLIIPISFFLSPLKLSENQKTRLFSLFAISSLLITTWGIFRSFSRLHVFLENGLVKSYKELTSHPAFSHYLRTYFEDATSIHPTYASIFLGISFLIFFYRLITSFSKEKNKLVFFYILGCLLSLVFLSILASRAPFAGTIIGASILYAFLIHNRTNFIWFSAGVVILVLGIYFLVPSFSARFNEVSTQNMGLPDAESQNSFNIRTGIYKCSFEIIKDNWLVGVGPGNLQTELNQCYNKISKEVYEVRDYNTHNQYLDYWASMGILAPILLLLLFGWVLIKNFHQKNWLAIAICALFFTTFFTENVLLRQNGVVIFSLFMSLFGFNLPQSQKKP